MVMRTRSARASTRDMFGNAEVWRRDPVKTFNAFVTSIEFVELGDRGQQQKGRESKGRSGAPLKPLRPQSVKIYQAMFGRFLKWCQEHNKPAINDLTDRDIYSFLHSMNARQRPMASAIRVKYLRLLERVYVHMGVQSNPASLAAQKAFDNKDAGKDKPKAWLVQSDEAAFMAALPDRGTWRSQRDRAILAVMIGAGLKVDEVVGLKLDDVGELNDAGELELQIRGTADGFRRDHCAIVRAFAVPDVIAWMKVRRSLFEKRADARFLFTTNSDGKGMHPSMVYRKVKEAFERAGLAPDRLGGRTLRNTFAIRELRQGGVTQDNVSMLTDLLGLHEQRSMLRYVVKEVRS